MIDFETMNLIAGKKLRCKFCNEFINKGEKYNRIDWLEDGYLKWYRAHIKCQMNWELELETIEYLDTFHEKDLFVFKTDNRVSSENIYIDESGIPHYDEGE